MRERIKKLWFPTLSFLLTLVISLFWVALPAGVIVFALKKRKLFHKCTRYVALLMAFMQVVALFSVFLTRPVEDKSLDWIVSEKDAFKMASDENTVVFVLDACDLTYLPQIRENDPEAIKEFDGFTYFADYAGSYSKTKMGLVYLLTQKWYENDQSIVDYIDTAYTDVPLYDALLENGWNMRIYTSETYVKDGYGYQLDAILADAQYKYIIGSIDEAGLEEQLKTWWTAGGEQVTKEMNDLYHAAGN